jgi:hypothetical protein
MINLSTLTGTTSSQSFATTILRIAFVDPQKVRVKGSEVGYTLSKIEKILSLQPEQKKAALKHDKLIAYIL